VPRKRGLSVPITEFRTRFRRESSPRRLMPVLATCRDLQQALGARCAARSISIAYYAWIRIQRQGEMARSRELFLASSIRWVRPAAGLVRNNLLSAQPCAFMAFQKGLRVRQRESFCGIARNRISRRDWRHLRSTFDKTPRIAAETAVRSRRNGEYRRCRDASCRSALFPSRRRSR
jgi:hypothetical protein